MVVRDFNGFRAVGARRPLETQPPLPVDPDAVLIFSVTRQSFQAIAGELRQVSQAGCRFQDTQTLFRLVTEALKSCHPLAFGETPSPRVFVIPDQGTV